MQLANYLHAPDIHLEPRILTKLQVYQQLVDSICHHHHLPICGKELLDLILKRDEESTTAYSSGIAIPHIRMDGFEDTVVGMTFLQNPLDFEGIKVHWVVLIITDKSSSKIYLNMVAALLKLSKDSAAMATLSSASDGHAVIRILKQMGVEVKKDLCIADIMVTTPARIQPEAFLSELSALMSGKEISVVPVTDEDNNYLGEVNILDFLKVGVPNYMMMMDNLNFLLSFEPLEHLFEKQDVVKVKEIMSKEEKYLAPEASIIEAVFEMIHYRKRNLCVVDHGKLVGIITAMDIFRKVIKA